MVCIPETDHQWVPLFFPLQQKTRCLAGYFWGSCRMISDPERSDGGNCMKNPRLVSSWMGGIPVVPGTVSMYCQVILIFFLHLGFEHPPSPQKILTQKILSLRNPGWVTPGSLPGDSGSHRKRQVDCLVRCGYTSLEFWHQVGRFYHSRLWPDTWWSDFGCQIVKHLGGLVIPYLAILR